MKSVNVKVLSIAIVFIILITTIADSTLSVSANSGSHKYNAARIPVLTYHRIYSDKVKNSKRYRSDRYSISVSTFDKQMKWLKSKGYRTLSCDEFYKWKCGTLRLPGRSVLITIDDGHAGSIENMATVLEKYGFKGTAFIIGRPSYLNDSYYISYNRIKEMQRDGSPVEFQSHTYNLHNLKAYKRSSYKKFLQDAARQKKLYGFKYIAYPHGRYSTKMIKAYKKSGIRMGFLFGKGKNGYATRKQNIYKIKRVEVSSSMSMSRFKKWCK